MNLLQSNPLILPYPLLPFLGNKKRMERYSRQALVLGGMSAQLSLSQASICVVGAGGIGSSALLYLAGAGIGSIAIIDSDVVEESNLHRQVIHDTSTLGRSTQCIHSF